MIRSKIVPFLRLQTVIQLGLWIYLRNIYFDLEPVADQNDLWKNVDIKHPPKFPDPIGESLRVNELLAHPQYDCKHVLPYPKDHRYAFGLCHDVQIEPIILDSQTTVISVAGVLDRLEFEADLMKISGGRLILLSADKTVLQLWDKLRKDLKDGVRCRAEMIYSPKQQTRPEKSGVQFRPKSNQNPLSLDSFHHFIMEQLEDWKLDKPYNKLIVKLDLGGVTNSGRFAQLIVDLIKKDFFKMVHTLHMVVHLPNMDEQLIYRWYNSLVSLFYGADLCLYQAMQFGQCGRSLVQCQYRLSFVKIPNNTKVHILAPIMGLGPPAKMKGNIDRFLQPTPLVWVQNDAVLPY